MPLTRLLPTGLNGLRSQPDLAKLFLSGIAEKINPDRPAAIPRWQINTEDQLRDFIWQAFGIRIPDAACCPNHTTPWRAFSDAYFARHSVAVWEASRGFGGKSFMLALLGLTEAITLKADVNILGGSGEQSGRVHKYMNDFWNYESAPRDLLLSDPSKQQTRLTWGNTIQALMASSKSVRGPHPQKLRIDEADEVDITLIDAAFGQPMSRNGIPTQIVLSSTHQYPDGTMTEIKKRAADKGWGYYTWCYRENLEPHGWLSSAEVERKRQDVTTAMWQTEYELQEPSPESRAIVPDAVESTFRPELGQYRGAPGEYIEIEAPDANGRYATGGDWAKEKDWTVIPTLRIDCHPARLVAYLREGRMPWPQMVAKFDERVRRYPLAAAHDGTGLGNVVSDLLTVKAENIILVGRFRNDLISNYIKAVESGEIEAPRIDHIYKEHKFATRDDIYGGGHLPDSICAMALAWHAANFRGTTWQSLRNLGRVEQPKGRWGDLSRTEQPARNRWG